MFQGIFTQRWYKWAFSPKKFVVGVEVKIGKKFAFLEIEVEARLRREAIELAKTIVKNQIQIIAHGSKSLGKVKRFNEF